MRLYMVRHGIAFSHGTPGMAEDKRPLTKEGTQKMQEAAKGLRAIDCIPEAILSSPLPRARQTAEIVLEALGKQIPLILVEALAPAGNRLDVYREIRKRQNSQSLMLVGHQPSLGEMAGDIAWGSPERFVELKKGGACALEIEAVTPSPRGTLVWLLTPSILRGLAA